MQDLRDRGLPACARIVGRGPAALIQPGPGIQWRGPVADLDSECRDVALALAPLTSGSGMKMKMLTYLAAGLPVLATTEATAGLADGHPGVVVCDDLSRWPEVAASLLADPAALTALGRAGREHVSRHHCWERVAARALDTYRRWLALPARPASGVPVPEGAAEPLWLVEHVSQDALGVPRLTTSHSPVVELPADRQTARVPDGQAEQTAVFGCGPFTVSLTAVPVVLEQLGVYFPQAASGEAGGQVAVVAARLAPQEVALRTTGLVGPRHGVASGHPQLAYQVWPDQAGGTILIPQSGPPHLIMVAAGRGSVEVLATDTGTLARTTIRVVRQLMIRHTERAGGLLGHAAAVAASGSVLLLAGRPGAGKTTVALLLARAGADLCAGDRTLLLPGPNGWDAAELPLAWRIAPGTLHAVALDTGAAALPVRARGHGLVDGKHEFTPQELCGLLGEHPPGPYHHRPPAPGRPAGTPGGGSGGLAGGDGHLRRTAHRDGS